MAKHDAGRHGKGSMQPIGASTSGGKMYEHEKSSKDERLIGKASGRGDHRA